jgi:hypothetical protein
MTYHITHVRCKPCDHVKIFQTPLLADIKLRANNFAPWLSTVIIDCTCLLITLLFFCEISIQVIRLIIWLKLAKVYLIIIIKALLVAFRTISTGFHQEQGTRRTLGERYHRHL